MASSSRNDRERLEPIRIFIGSGPRNFVEERVFVHTIEKYSTSHLEINIIDGATGSVTFSNGDVKRLPSNLVGRVSGATAFSTARYAIPEWCDYRGKAIYCDSDQIVLTDISELWTFDLSGRAVAAVPVRKASCSDQFASSFLKRLIDSEDDYYLTSVMLIDCAATHAWNLDTIIEKLDENQYSYLEMMFLGKRFIDQFGTSVKDLPSEWNHLDTLLGDTKLVHFTDLTSQPWLSHINRVAETWEGFFIEAIDRGVLSLADIDLAYKEGVISNRIRVLPRVNRKIAHPVNSLWRSLAGSRFLLFRYLKNTAISARVKLRRITSAQPEGLR